MVQTGFRLPRWFRLAPGISRLGVPVGRSSSDGAGSTRCLQARCSSRQIVSRWCRCRLQVVQGAPGVSRHCKSVIQGLVS